MSASELADEVVVQFVFWSAVAFIVGYTALAPWWRHVLGWARILLDFGIALVLMPSVLYLTFGVSLAADGPWAWYEVGSFAFVGFISLWNLGLVIHEQFRKRK